MGSSGGASDGLALVAEHPEQVRTLVAHEPPLAKVLPDSEAALAAAGSIQETYEREGMGPAMARFLALASLKGPIPAEFAEQPGPNPAVLRAAGRG
jgi:pimeloyl-ACP methyl ester carboxylesterase